MVSKSREYSVSMSLSISSSTQERRDELLFIGVVLGFKLVGCCLVRFYWVCLERNSAFGHELKQQKVEVLSKFKRLVFGASCKMTFVHPGDE